MTDPKRARLPVRRSRRRSRLAFGAVGVLATTLLAACGSGDGGKPELTWYINPDAGGQAAVAAACSTDDYTITTQTLPQDAGQQRVQLVRRLSAEDSGIDLMSIDPPFTAEFANAGFLAEIPQDMQDKFKAQAFESAVTAATWEDNLVVAPFWSNVQVLWYRKSFAEKAGLDMSQPVTWDQVIDAAADNGGQIGVQANKYEGYTVFINALISGAGGDIASDTEAGADASIDIDSAAGEDAAKVLEKLASSEAAPGDLSVSNEGTAGTTFGGESGSFLVNWTYIWGNYPPDRLGDDIGYARYPQTVEGEESRPPFGGIGIGVSEYSDHKEEAVAALECLTNAQNQATNAQLTGNMPSSTAGYDELKKLDEQRMADESAADPDADPQPLFPDDLVELFQTSLDAAAPRTVTPYWADISGAIQASWHPPSGVTDETPKESKDLIEDVLDGGLL